VRERLASSGGLKEREREREREMPLSLGTWQHVGSCFCTLGMPPKTAEEEEGLRRRKVYSRQKR